MRIPFFSKKKNSENSTPKVKKQKPRTLSIAEASAQRQRAYIKRLNDAGNMRKE